MNALTIGLALLVMGCAAIEGDFPALDQAMDRAARTGYCVKIKCGYPPLKCGPGVGVCK